MIQVHLSKKLFEQLTEYMDTYDTQHLAVFTIKPDFALSTSSEKSINHIKNNQSVDFLTSSMYSHGTVCKVLSHGIKPFSSSGLVTLQGQGRVRMDSCVLSERLGLLARLVVIPDRGNSNSAQVKALTSSVISKAADLINDDTSRMEAALFKSRKQESSKRGGSSPRTIETKVGGDHLISMLSSKPPEMVVNLLAGGLLGLSVSERQQILEEPDITCRLNLLNNFVASAAEAKKLTQEIYGRMQKEANSKMREKVIRGFIAELNRELQKLSPAEGEENVNDVERLRKKIAELDMSEQAASVARYEVGRLAQMHISNPEYGSIKAYVETLTSFPWGRYTDDCIDLCAARKILDADHHGLDQVKKRIVESLAVRKLKGTAKGSILCFHGPPGVGKTSLGKSIAASMGRKFIRISLGGVRDETEIRGHRRTYLGSMPGVIVQSMIRADTSNPVVLLDELDKLASGESLVCVLAFILSSSLDMSKKKILNPLHHGWEDIKTRALHMVTCA